LSFQIQQKKRDYGNENDVRTGIAAGQRIPDYRAECFVKGKAGNYDKCGKHGVLSEIPGKRMRRSGGHHYEAPKGVILSGLGSC
jgi:hypothetical protein